MDARGHCEGERHAHQVLLYALSTCGWCGRMRALLEDAGVTFDYVYVDLVSREERERIRARIRRLSEAVSFPTVVVDETVCIVGYKPETVRAHLGLDKPPSAT